MVEQLEQGPSGTKPWPKSQYPPATFLTYVKIYLLNKKSRIQETKQLSTDSSTNAIGGWAKNTQKPDFFLNGKNHQKRKNSEMSRNMTKLVIRPSTRGL